MGGAVLPLHQLAVVDDLGLVACNRVELVAALRKLAWDEYGCGDIRAGVLGHALVQRVHPAGLEVLASVGVECIDEVAHLPELVPRRLGHRASC